MDAEVRLRVPAAHHDWPHAAETLISNAVAILDVLIRRCAITGTVDIAGHYGFPDKPVD